MRVNIMGKSLAPGIECSNSVWDEIDGGYYCSVQHFRELNLQKEVYKWLPAMIECYWQNGIQSDDLEFLEAGKFVTLYRYETCHKLSVQICFVTSNFAL